MAARVGLTGGIGSGKSTVVEMFSSLGILVIDADQVARKITAPGTSGLADIVQHFGSGILLTDSSLDRKQLGKIVFADTGKRKWLEDLLHPQIRRLMDDQSDQCIDPFCILEIPLLIETSRFHDMDQVVVVHCPEETRIQRLQDARKMDRQSIEAIIKNQASDRQRLALADHVLDNSGDLEALWPQVKQLHKLLLYQYRYSV
jgi:dephospho-CoA kinase